MIKSSEEAMGKRKERRRHAAMSNAGRRVKLDLFAEPSGDLGGSTVHGETGEGADLKHQAGLPNSPTSSGQQPENPLLLLGQYSDDELEEESTERSDDATLENLLAENVDEVEKPSGEEHERTDANAIKNLSAQNIKKQDMDNDCTLMDTLLNVERHCNRESNAITSGDFCKTGPAEQVSILGAADVQDQGEVIASGWKMVMHEESNQYYYWNTETGETSWEVPEVLACTSELAHSMNAEKIENASVSAHELSSTLDVKFSVSSTPVALDSSMDPNLILQGEGMHDKAPGTYVFVGQENKSLNNEIDGTDQSNVRSDFGVVTINNSSTADSERSAYDTRANEEQKSAVNVSSHILRRSEHLLGRLKSLKGSKSHLQGHDWVEKYILEVEIRLSDFKALLPYGASLIPFWVHSERQLKRLENIVDDEVGQLVKSEQDNEIKASDLYSGRSEDSIKKSAGHISEAENNENKTVTAPENLHGSSFDFPTGQSESVALVSEQVIETAFQGEFMPQQEFHAGEDVDMDVDMEVEDAIPVGNSSIKNLSDSKDFAPLGPLQPNQSAEYPSSVSDYGFTIPPPPDDEWIPPPPPDSDNEYIPPPPPDNEEVPPPPPDEPPEPSYPVPPSCTETRQPLSYADLYSSSYPNSNFEYYGQMVTEVSSNSLYGHADGSQINIPHAPLYYESVPNTYVEAAPVVVNPVETVAYYGLQDGTVPSLPVLSSIESTQFHTVSGFTSYSTLASNQIGSTAAHSVEPGVIVGVSGVGVEGNIPSVEASSIATTIQSAALSAEESVAAAAAVAAAPSKASKSKVLRAKKRTAAVPSLMSNKKVSTLVDKWKAAKEELHEDEEEPESAYEFLEKKRQREIDEWRAKQIASEEAKDNANFQPLGSDWRERVKRRRAQKASVTAETMPQEATDRNEQPDLVELSKNLPTGWQAYWDDSSKQVYFGNTITSETTWTRPAK